MIKKENDKARNESVNFIDSNDNFVGFDLSQCCCEHAFYVFYKKEENAFVEVEFENIPEHVTIRCKEDFNIHPDLITAGQYDEGGGVVFRLSDGYYLQLVNIHNGYYSHAYEYRIDTTAEKDLYI